MMALDKRPGPRGPLALAAAAAAALALAGCANEATPAAPTAPTAAPAAPAAPATPATPATPAEPQQQTVAWTDSVCGAVVPIAQNLSNPPEVDVTAPGATRDAYLSYLTQAQAATDKALQDVTAAGPAPVDSGEQVTADVRDQLTDLRDDLADAKTQLEKANPNDVTSIGRAVIAAGNVAGAVGNNAQALSALDGNPRLDAAFDQAQSCQQLRTIQTPGRGR